MTKINFNAKQYWSTRKNPNNTRVDRTAERAFIRKHTADAKTILDLGCGTGAMLKEYPKDADILGADFTDNYREQYLNKGRAVNHIILDTTKQQLPESASFDVCVLSKVLLHANEQEARLLIHQAVKASKRVIITTALTKNPAAHCFNHDYALYLMNYEAIGLKTESNKQTGELFIKFETA